MAVSQFLGDVGALLGSPKASNLPGIAKQALEKNPGSGLLDLSFSQQTPNRAAQLMGAPQRQPGGGLLSFFGRPGTRDAMGQIGDYLLTSNDMQPIYGPHKARRDERMMSEKLAQYLGADDPALMEIIRGNSEVGFDMLKAKRELRDRMALEQEQARLKAAAPDYATVNNRRIRYDPTSDESTVVFVAPQDFEDYAAALGAEPGTPEYERLVQDYVLRGSGPTGTDNYMRREDQRQGNRVSMEAVRQRNRAAIKGMPTYRDRNPRPRVSGGVSRRGGSLPTATNPATGQKMVYRGNKWVPAQ
jgi:hypothetical protein